MEVMDKRAISNIDRGERYSRVSVIHTIPFAEHRLRRFRKVSESAPQMHEIKR
jgi:hypothetical protein